LVEVSQALDRIKDAGFYWATRSGVSMSIADANFDFAGEFDAERAKMILKGEEEHTKIQEAFDVGGITDLERRDELGALWFKKTNEIQDILQKAMPADNAIRIMVESGARGNWIQVRSVLGMRGPVATSSGDFAPMPVKGNYLVGLTASEYFINATGARKGNADTAMKTSAAGYLTRRLVDVAQDVIVREQDCGTTAGLLVKSGPLLAVEPISKDETQEEFEARNSFDSRYARTVKTWRKEGAHYTFPHLSPADYQSASSSDKSSADSQKGKDLESVEINLLSRRLAKDVKEGKTVIAKAGDMVSKTVIERILDASSEVTEVEVRSPLTCKSESGVCATCYGESLANRKPVELGEAIGIIGAQSIGEPGTQLTMRTFHTGGAAEKTTTATILKSIGGQKVRVERLISYDITQGLTGVTDQLEARIGAGSVAKRADMAWWKGKVEVVERNSTDIQFDAEVAKIQMETEQGFVDFVPGEVTRSIKLLLNATDPENPNADLKGKTGLVSDWDGKIVSITRKASSLDKVGVASDVEGTVQSVNSKAIVIALKSEKSDAKAAKAETLTIEISAANGATLVSKGDAVKPGTILVAGKITKTVDVSKAKFEIGKVVQGKLAKNTPVFASLNDAKFMSFDRDVEILEILQEQSGKLVPFAKGSATKRIEVTIAVEDPEAGSGKMEYELSSSAKRTAKTPGKEAMTKSIKLSSSNGREVVKPGQRVKPGQLLVTGQCDITYLTENFKFEVLKKGKVTKGMRLVNFTDKPKIFEVYVVPQNDQDEKSAFETAERFQFGRTNNRSTRKLGPYFPVSFLSDLSDLVVADGQMVEPGEFIKDGIPDPREVLYLLGSRACAAEIIRGVQAIYGSQGVPLHDKHLEVIVRQMLGKVMIYTSGGTSMHPGEIRDFSRFQAENKEARKNNIQTAEARPEIMGITRASLASESWLAAASFQETTRVLTQAALERKADTLEGLKENVIIGKLIPAGTGLKRYRDVKVEGTKEAKEAKYPNRMDIWDTPVATESAEQISVDDLSFTDLAGWSETKED
jgi:hypothetical protein